MITIEVTKAGVGAVRIDTTDAREQSEAHLFLATIAKPLRQFNDDIKRAGQWALPKWICFLVTNCFSVTRSSPLAVSEEPIPIGQSGAIQEGEHASTRYSYKF
jgi:hypothetical protein